MQRAPRNKNVNTPPRKPPRLKGVVQNRGIKKKKKPKKK